MQALSRLTIVGCGRIRAATAWLAIAAVLGSTPLPAPARAACAPRPASARACALCHRSVAPLTTSAIARPPCCGCEIGSDSHPAAPPASLSLERPTTQWQGAALSIASSGALSPQCSPRFKASDPPDAPPESPVSTTVLRI